MSGSEVDVEQLQRAAVTMGEIISSQGERICEIAGVPMPEDGDADYQTAWERAHDMPVQIKALTAERDWLANALQDQEQAYAALEAQFLAVSDAHAALVDQISALAAGAIR